MLSKNMEAFLSNELKESVDADRSWRIIGNPSVIAKTVSPNLQDPMFNKLTENLTGKRKAKIDKLALLGELGLPEDLDMWDGYPAARERFYQIANKAGASDLLVVSGDSHSFWANELYDNANKSMGVELGATGISSPRSIMEELGTDIMLRYDQLNSAQNKEIVWTDGRHRGFIRLEINHQSGHADFIIVSNVESREYETKIIHCVDIEKTQKTLKFKN
jgi:alkaline phosphatase D